MAYFAHVSINGGPQDAHSLTRLWVRNGVQVFAVRVAGQTVAFGETANFVANRQATVVRIRHTVTGAEAFRLEFRTWQAARNFQRDFNRRGRPERSPENRLSSDRDDDEDGRGDPARDAARQLEENYRKKRPLKRIENTRMAPQGRAGQGRSHYMPPVVLKRKDASMVVSTWDEFDHYDKVLFDAPCLTDRLSVNQEEGNIFDPMYRSIRLELPHTQTKMLVNALRSVKVGGCVVYSTCTLTPAQNEQVVENAVALAGTYYGIECVERSLEMLGRQLAVTGLYRFSPQCRRGITVIPWKPTNFGPMYVAKLERIK